MIDEKLLKSEEKAVFALRALYRQYGYLPYKMSKFEEYELYSRNKDFLVSDRIITFNDTNGRLMALKPDVTLSIIKNGEDRPGCKQKVCYNENVYRVSESSHHFKEIMQAGLECIGDIDLYDIYETVSLAARSLSLISESFVLEISHLGIAAAVLDAAGGDEDFRRGAMHFIAEKNAHDLHGLCREYAIPPEKEESLAALITAYGCRETVLEKLKALDVPGAAEPLAELERLSRMLESLPGQEKIQFDFSVVNDMNYYNGIVFKGFLNGICEGVLAGGQYDKLMEKMGRRSRAIGFALYLDLLEQLPTPAKEYDVEVLLLYDEGEDPEKVAEAVRKITEEGRTVSAQKSLPAKLRCRQVCRLKEGKIQC